MVAEAPHSAGAGAVLDGVQQPHHFGMPAQLHPDDGALVDVRSAAALMAEENAADPLLAQLFYKLVRGIGFQGCKFRLRRLGGACLRPQPQNGRNAVAAHGRTGTGAHAFAQWRDDHDGLAAQGHNHHLSGGLRRGSQCRKVLLGPVDRALVAQSNEIIVIRRRKGGPDGFRKGHPIPPLLPHDLGHEVR